MIIKFSELSRKEIRKKIIEEMSKGACFIYPTDTIYGIGCNALDDRAVKKIRKLKKREKKPFSVIAPGKEWIYENFELDRKFRVYIEKLPGPFTYILKIKPKLKEKRKIISKNINFGLKTLGVRIPAHPFTKLVKELGKPFVTTSVNLSGQPYARSMDEIPEEFKKDCIIIDAGKLKGKPSLLIDLTGKIPKILKR